MSDDLAPTIALGIGSALLAFECFAALISLLQVRCASIRRPPSSAAQLQTTPALSFTQRVAVWAHFTAQRDLINAMRRQYPTLRSTRHGQELRGAIRRLPRHPIAENPRQITRAVGSRARGVAAIVSWDPRLAAPARDAGLTGSATVGRQRRWAAPARSRPEHALDLNALSTAILRQVYKAAGKRSSLASNGPRSGPVVANRVHGRRASTG